MGMGGHTPISEISYQMNVYMKRVDDTNMFNTINIIHVFVFRTDSCVRTDNKHSHF